MIQRDGSSLLCVEFYGDSLDALVARMEAVERDLKGAGHACRIRHVLDLAKQAKIWSFREAALGLSTAMKSDGKAISFVEDTAVAPEKLRDYIERFIAIVRRHRHHRGRLRACLGGLPARAAGGEPENRRRRGDV